MLICVNCGRIVARVNETVKYTSCSACLYGESDFVSADELIYPQLESTA